MSEESVGSMYGTTPDAVVTQDVGGNYASMGGNTSARPDTLLEANMTDDQLLGAFNGAAQQLEDAKTRLASMGVNVSSLSTPVLLSHDRGMIQAALNEAQANLNAAEGIALQQRMMQGTMAIAGAGAILGGGEALAVGAVAAQGAEQSVAVSGNGLETQDFSMRKGLFGALLRDESNIVALGSAQNVDRGSLGEFVPTHINGVPMRHVDLGGEKAMAEARGYTGRGMA